MIGLDTGDSNVYSVFRNSRYTANFVCVVSFYRATVYLQDNSAPLFLKAIEYAVRVFQYLSGNPVRKIVSDIFSAYMDTRLIANFRDDKGIILSVMLGDRDLDAPSRVIFQSPTPPPYHMKRSRTRTVCAPPPHCITL